jgi:hypothetical protein
MDKVTVKQNKNNLNSDWYTMQSISSKIPIALTAVSMSNSNLVTFFILPFQKFKIDKTHSL